MEPQYIVAIVSGGIFLILILTYIILRVIRDKKELREKARISQIYNDEALEKMEYDFAMYDEESSEILSEQSRREGYTDVNEEPVQHEEVFAKVDSEGMEEITGNYKPE